MNLKNLKEDRKKFISIISIFTVVILSVLGVGIFAIASNFKENNNRELSSNIAETSTTIKVANNDATTIVDNNSNKATEDLTNGTTVSNTSEEVFETEKTTATEEINHEPKDKVIEENNEIINSDTNDNNSSNNEEYEEEKEVEKEPEPEPETELEEIEEEPEIESTTRFHPSAPKNPTTAGEDHIVYNDDGSINFQESYWYKSMDCAKAIRKSKEFLNLQKQYPTFVRADINFGGYGEIYAKDLYYSFTLQDGTEINFGFDGINFYIKN